VKLGWSRRYQVCQQATRTATTGRSAPPAPPLPSTPAPGHGQDSSTSTRVGCDHDALRLGMSTFLTDLGISTTGRAAQTTLGQCPGASRQLRRRGRGGAG
jgi:hypothetical protein